MDDGAVSYMGTFAQVDGGAGEHVDDAVFLDVTSCFKDNAPPIAAKDSAGSDVTILSNGHMANDGCLRVYVGARIDHGHHAFEGLDHAALGLRRTVA